MPPIVSSTPCCNGSEPKRCVVGAVLLVLAMLAAASPRSAGADQLVVKPFASISEQWTDNVFFSDMPQADYITSVAVGIGLSYGGPRFSGYLSGANTSQIFARDTSQDRAAGAQYVTASGTYSISPRWSVSLSDGLNHVDQARVLGPPVPSDGSSGPNVPPGNEASLLVNGGDVFSNVASVATSYRFTPLITGTLAYSNGVNDLSNPGTTDVTNRVLANAVYLWDPALSFSVFYSFTNFNFTDQPDGWSQAAGIGSGWTISPTWSTGGSVGVFVNQITSGGTDSDLPQEVGPTFDLFLTGTFESWQVDLSGGQQISTSGGVAGISITRDVSGTVTYQLGRGFSAYAFTGYSRFETSATTFDVVQAIGGVNYEINRYLSAVLLYSYRFRHNDQATASLTQGDVDGNVVMLGLSGSYDIWSGTTSEVAE